ncbi:MAG: peptidoglycan DD-metalloendopeptidase family protein [Butyricicoccus sp.]
MTEKRHGKGLLFIVTLVLAAGVIRYADIPFAQTVREKAASALSGAANADHVLAVFGGSAMPADTVPAESSGGADDILDRDQTLFPDTVDQTVSAGVRARHADFRHADVLFRQQAQSHHRSAGFHYGRPCRGRGTHHRLRGRHGARDRRIRLRPVRHCRSRGFAIPRTGSISAKVGDKVTCGEQIAKVGQTGNATGPHLHLELWHNGAALDPADYLAL